MWYLLSLIFSFFLLSFFIFPTFFYSTYIDEQRIIMGGYGGNMGHYNTLLFSLENASSLIKLIFYHFLNIIYQIICSLVVPYSAKMDGVWAHNLYVGKFGFILLVLCVFSYFRRFSFIKIIKQPIFIICLVVFVLSLSIVEQQIFIFLDNVLNLKIPVVDRLPSRLMIYPFCVILIFAALGFDSLFRRVPEKFRNICKYTTIIFLFFSLMEHSYDWSVAKTESNYSRPIDEDRHLFNSESTVILDISSDIRYIKTVNYSFITSIATFFLFSILLFYLKRTDKKIFSLN